MFIEDLVEISLVGIVDAYIHLKNVQREGNIQRLKKVKEHTVNEIINTLFIAKSKSDTEGLTFKELNKKFDNDKWV